MPTANINNHTMYYETHGDGPPVLCMTGWGTICHGRILFLPESLQSEDYRVIIFDHRGIGESEDIDDMPHSADLYAEDAAGLLDHLGVTRVHVVGMGGMGGLIGQKLAINHHDRVASLAMFGAWAKPDPYLADQLRLLNMLHAKVGFEAYQMCAALFCYTPEHYNAHRDSIVSSKGPWQMLRGRFERG